MSATNESEQVVLAFKFKRSSGPVLFSTSITLSNPLHPSITIPGV